MEPLTIFGALIVAAIPGTDVATDITVWVVLVATVLGLLTAGRKILTGPLEREASQMNKRLEELEHLVTRLAEQLSHVMQDVAVIKDRQKRIADKIDTDDPRE